ncbi:hypothetical protein CKA38_09405 [Ereboglobus luteus]|uniref:Uncharacterized protein n=2 Tax=Ereboglobus luteus TaxID=1796921 RepID=A0A2U8E4I1_9BACT|nr:hypothetical protein CKA38_09405 [Ereboglobus luteus]
MRVGYFQKNDTGAPGMGLWAVAFVKGDLLRAKMQTGMPGAVLFSKKTVPCGGARLVVLW